MSMSNNNNSSNNNNHSTNNNSTNNNSTTTTTTTTNSNNDSKRSQFSTKQRMDMYAFCVMELELNSHKVSMKKQHDAMRKAISEKHQGEFKYVQQQRLQLHKQQMLKHEMEMNFRRVKYLQKLQTPQPLLQRVDDPEALSQFTATSTTDAAGSRQFQIRSNSQQGRGGHYQPQPGVSPQYKRVGQQDHKQIIVVVNGPPPQSPEQMQLHIQQLLLQHPEVQRVMQQNPQSQIHFQLKFQPQSTPTSRALTPKNSNQTIIVIDDTSLILNDPATMNNQPETSGNGEQNSQQGQMVEIQNSQQVQMMEIQGSQQGQMTELQNSQQGQMTEMQNSQQGQMTEMQNAQVVCELDATNNEHNIDQSLMEAIDKEQADQSLQQHSVPATASTSFYQQLSSDDSRALEGSINFKDREVKPPRALSCYSDFQRAQVLTTGMLKNVQDRYSTYYPDGPTPSRTTIKHVFERCVTLGTVENKTRTRKSTKLPMGDEIEYLLIHEPQLSLRQLAQKLNVSTGTVSRRCKQLGLVPESVTIKQHQLQTARRQKQMKQLETISKSLGNNSNNNNGNNLLEHMTNSNDNS